MKHNTIFLALILLCYLPLSAQLTDCDCTNRYQTEIFDNIDVQTVTYSDTYSLQMDIYTPSGDVCVNRPLIILAHGGSFIGGSKSNPTVVDLCETFAKRGYVAASINYRLLPDYQFPDYLHDAKAAIRWLRGNEKNYYLKNHLLNLIVFSPFREFFFHPYL